MKNLILTLILVLCSSVVIKADMWAVPSTRNFCSENGKYCLTVEPKFLDDQLSYFLEKADKKDADKIIKENYCKGTFTADGKKRWIIAACK